ncbi:MAG TPA: hypothetical protein VNJ01_01950 [Bacteriovoracaceae bacterium]|nr:hypothetical protein [Bacteriovoracaceae bacterium]
MKLVSFITLSAILSLSSCAHKSCSSKGHKEEVSCHKEKKKCCSEDKKCSDGSCEKKTE